MTIVSRCRRFKETKSSSLMWLRPRVAACSLEIVRLREVADLFDHGHQDSASVSSSEQFWSFSAAASLRDRLDRVTESVLTLICGSCCAPIGLGQSPGRRGFIQRNLP